MGAIEKICLKIVDSSYFKYAWGFVFAHNMKLVSWKAFAGNKVFFDSILKTPLFGKTIKTVELPEGDLKTVKIHYNGMKNLKKKIAEKQNPKISADKIKQLFSYEAFSQLEKIESTKDLLRVRDDQYVLWTRSEKPLPKLNKIEIQNPESMKTLKEMWEKQ